MREKKKSLGRRVVVYVLLLGMISLMGIYLNKFALWDIADKNNFYEVYFRIQTLNKDIDVSYIEAQKYANLYYFLQEDLMLEKCNNELGLINEKKKELFELTQTLKNEVTQQLDTELIDAINMWSNSMQEFEDAVSVACEAALSGDSTQMLQVADEFSNYVDKIQESETVYEQLLDQRIGSLRKRVNIRISGTNQFTTILIAINVIVIMIIISALAKKLVKPAKNSQERCVEIINKLQSGNGDLTERVPVSTNDEVGALSNGINQVLGQMHNIIRMLGSHANILQGVSETVADHLNKTEEEMLTVSSTMQEMSAASEETSAALEQIKGEVGSINGMIGDVYKQATSQVLLAEDILSKVSHMRDNAMSEREASDESAKLIVKSLESSIESVRKVDDINTLVDDILNISSQTNLLSLNASIEAARAGEAGKGFSVVADEISKLAHHSAGAATHIQEVAEGVIKAVNDLAQKAQMMSQTLLESNANGKREITALSDSYCNDIDHITKSMNEFANTSSQVQSVMSVIKEAVDSINIAVEETAQGITNITASTAEMTHSLASIKQEAQKNLEISSTLYKEVSKFKL